MPADRQPHQFEKFNLMEVQMRTPYKKKSDKIRKKIEDGCKSCNCPSLKCAYNEIERAEIRMGPNDRRNRIIELLSFRRHETPAASRVRGGDRAGVVSSKTPAESVNGCANTLPVMFPVSGVRAANVAHLLNYLLLPFRANRGQQEPKHLLPIILL